MLLYYFYLLALLILPSTFSKEILDKRALQPSHEKSQQEKWADAFIQKSQADQQVDLVMLLKKITRSYLLDCTPIILFDSFTEKNDNLLLEKLLTNFPTAYIHGQITEDYNTTLKISVRDMQPTCITYLLFMKDVMKSKDVIGVQSNNKVIVVARSSQWRVFEFLSHEESRFFVNLLVIVQSERIMEAHQEAPYILYTHKLYVDALGSSKPIVLSSFQDGNLTRKVNLFPKKLSGGFSGHRFIVSMSHQPPYIISKGRTIDGEKIFEGVEIRLVNLLSKLYNFTTDYREATEDNNVGSSEAVTRTIEKKKANIGIGGIYVTPDKLERVGLTTWHSRDCAAFISLASTALPRYRAILGPLHWSVWLALILVYLGGIFPLAFSDKHTLRHLITNPAEIENMFWYVFGTFTNCFTFSGKGSWSRANKVTTKLLIGFYWIFTIIITACYTGSIIAFVTLPVFPSVVDSAEQLLSGWYQIGTLDKGEWQYLFQNSSDDITKKLLKNVDLVPTVEEGLKNTTKMSFWRYAFLGSKAQLDYIVRTNMTTRGKRSVLHISKECFVPFSVALAYPSNSVYAEILNRGIERIKEAGIMMKFRTDVEWEMMRSATGKLLAATTGVSLKTLAYEDRALSLEDTQGMFLLLAIGFVFGGGALVVEWFGGCYKICRRNKRRGSDDSIESNPRMHERQLPQSKWKLKERYEHLKRSFEEKLENSSAKTEEYYNDDKNSEQIDNIIDKIFEDVLKNEEENDKKISSKETKNYDTHEIDY
ncbi:unnamed protein product [Phyllotreta striolata]|uniref:Ionotropic glutamate receptor C-terminal domain-containing protein n=1 Tax=Phyllotreta striolata TaxID=444603 RepID=A0A9N9XIG8_PHYSR|nr:unnamed protein product [Phyllotreta striolata]